MFSPSVQVSSEAALETIQAVLPVLQSAGTPWRARGALGRPYRNSVTLMSGPCSTLEAPLEFCKLASGAARVLLL